MADVFQPEGFQKLCINMQLNFYVRLHHAINQHNQACGYNKLKHSDEMLDNTDQYENPSFKVPYDRMETIEKLFDNPEYLNVNGLVDDIINQWVEKTINVPWIKSSPDNIMICIVPKLLKNDDGTCFLYLRLYYFINK